MAIRGQIMANYAQTSAALILDHRGKSGQQWGEPA